MGLGKRALRGPLALFLILSVAIHRSTAAKVNELLEANEPVESDVLEDVEYSIVIDPSLNRGFVGAGHRREVG